MAITLAGCSGATAKKAEPDPEPMEPAPPSLLGTWKIEHAPDESGEYEHFTLTFRPDRWAIVLTRYDAAGAVIDTGAGQGGWQRTDTQLTRIHLDRDSGVPVSTARRYMLTDTTLTVADWNHDAADTAELAVAAELTYMRVTDPATLAGGRWTRMDGAERETLEFTADGWTYIYHDDPDLGGEDFTADGVTWTDDAEAGVIMATVDMAPELPWWVGQTLRFAYVPTGDGGVNVSMWFREQMAVGEGAGRHFTAPNEETPYGDYGHRFQPAE